MKDLKDEMEWRPLYENGNENILNIKNGMRKGQKPGGNVGTKIWSMLLEGSLRENPVKNDVTL